MNIGIDLDSTLSQMGEKWLALYNAEFDDDLAIETITDWNMAQFARNCSEEVFNGIIRRPGFFLSPLPMPGAVEALKDLYREHEVYIVTAYHSGDCVDKHEWIHQHFPFFDPSNVVFCNKKHIIATDVLIDDGPHNHEGFGGIPILFDRPWNREARGLRIHSWENPVLHKDPGWSLLDFLCKK